MAVCVYLFAMLLYHSLHIKWLEVVTDVSCSVSRMVHLNIHWMVCTGSSVTDYVAALRRKTQQMGLKVMHAHIVSYHVMSSHVMSCIYMDMHPQVIAVPP